jgi:glycosyltransferase Alg8
LSADGATDAGLLPAQTALGGFTAHSPRSESLAGGIVFVIPLLAMALLMRSGIGDGAHRAVLAGLSVIGLWRYSWAATHYLRACWYRYRRYPQLRTGLDPARERVDHVAVVITSFRIEAEINAAVYAALFRELLDYGARATVVACMTDPADARLLLAVGKACGCEGRMDVALIPQAGLGKRHAMARALRHLASLALPSNSAVVLMDGDTLIRRGILRHSLPLLRRYPEVGALTVDNIPLVRGSTISREWYRLRMAQRHLLMCSIALSRKLLVLTGRFSIYRGAIAFDPGFAERILDDEVHHWRFGRIKMLSGDDKSTWFWVLSRGWQMLYLPDVSVYCLEELPSPSFVRGSTSLMRRWFGNMVRASGRALGLGWRRVGLFPYLALIDQRLSLWTALIGPTLCLSLALFQGPHVLGLYLVWVTSVRTVQALIVGVFAGRFNIWFPLLLYYGQTVGSAIKIWATFHPNVQNWTRQKIRAADSAAHATSTLLMAMSLLAFVMAVLLFGGVLDRVL